MAGCATRHHRWAVNPPVDGTKCVGKLNGAPCPAVYSAPGGTQTAAREPQPAPAGAPSSPENSPAPAPRATLGAALAMARATQGAPSAPAGTAAPGPALPPAPPEPQAWQRMLAAKSLSLLFMLNDKAMELRHREPMEDPPKKGDDEFDAATDSLSQQIAIWCPATALPPWGQAAIITAGMLGDRWIMSTPVEAEEEKPAARGPVGATAAATRPATPPPATAPAASAPVTAGDLG